MDSMPVIYFGSSDPGSPARKLRAGGLQCIYQAGTIRHVRAGDREILRMIYPAVRDRNWGTVPGIITNERIVEDRQGFSIRYDCRYAMGEIDYMARVRLLGGLENTLAFSMQGKALSRFLKNRIGLNILYPVKECAGRKGKVTTPEGTEYEAEFPRLVSPLQPMKNIRSLAWTLEGGINALLRLSGEVFEMEDQRNWTDASYKIYCTPLDLPFPVAVEPGEALRQEVFLKVETQGRKTAHDDANRVMLAEAKNLLTFPAIGLGRSSETLSLHSADMELIRKTGFRHYRVDLQLYQDGWDKKLPAGVEEAAGMGLALELGLFFGDGHTGQLAAFIEAISRHDPPVDRFLVFTSDHLNDRQLSEAVIPVLKSEFPGAAAGTGTDANFAELNRNRPPPGGQDFLAYSVNPQVHAADPLSLVENLEGQKYTVLSARSFAADKPISVTPVTLKPRFNIDATAEDRKETPAGALPSRYDHRQPSLFCAGWTLGSLKYLAEAGAGSVTYFETMGRGGIIHGFNQPLSPGIFKASHGELYPVYYFFRELLKYKDYRIRATESSHPLRFSSLLLQGKDEQILALANHTGTRQRIMLPAGLKTGGSWVMDEYSLQNIRKGEYLREPSSEASIVPLNPYAVSFVKTNIIK